MADKFGNTTDGITAPAGWCVEITPADVDLDFVTRALYIGTAGDVKIITANGNTVTFVAVLGGSILPVRALQVMAATGASNIIGMY